MEPNQVLILQRAEVPRLQHPLLILNRRLVLLLNCAELPDACIGIDRRAKGAGEDEGGLRRLQNSDELLVDLGRLQRKSYPSDIDLLRGFMNVLDQSGEPCLVLDKKGLTNVALMLLFFQGLLVVVCEFPLVLLFYDISFEFFFQLGELFDPFFIVLVCCINKQFIYLC